MLSVDRKLQASGQFYPSYLVFRRFNRKQVGFVSDVQDSIGNNRGTINGVAEVDFFDRFRVLFIGG